MESSLVKRVLTDGSAVWDIVFVDGSQKVVISCVSQIGAFEIQDALFLHANGAEIEPNRAGE